MTVHEALKKYHKVEIDILLSHVLKKPKEFLFMHPEFKLTTKQVNDLTKLARRRQKGEPVAYLVGYKDFCGLRFRVNRDVLIPRPETEWIVDAILNEVKDNLSIDNKVKRSLHSAALGRDDKMRILDVATGSGCIIVSIAKKLHPHPPLPPRGGGQGRGGYELYASDISEKALQVAKQNARAHKAKVKFIKSNLVTSIEGKFGIIIANLPYVPKAVYRLKIKDLKYEPKQALIDPKKDFNLYEKFLQQASKILNPKSLIFLEIDPKTVPYLKKWTRQYLPDKKIEFHKDFRNLWRYAIIRPKE